MGSVADIVAPSEQVTQSKKTKRKHDIPMPQQLEISLQYAIQQLDICLPDNAEGFAQCPEIPATMMDAMNDSITKDARMLIFDSLVEVAEDLFCQHDRYNAPGRYLALHHIPKPTNISKKRLIAHCEKELQALMKLGETTKADYHYDATVQKITNDTANVIANGYCNLEVDEIYVREQLVQALWDKMLKETAQDMFKS
jgi:hypothetical protein